jgi:hypothetical protein
MNLVAAICACPPSFNPGMASVDLALHALFQRHALPAELRFYRLYTPAEFGTFLPAARRPTLSAADELPFTYGVLRGRLDVLRRSAAILYWGDFLHSHDYVHDIARVFHHLGAATTERGALRMAYRHLYLAGLPEATRARVIAFGGTLIFNRQSDYEEAAYARHLSGIVTGARRVWMRDVYSALRVAELQGRSRVDIGVDGSLLLRDSDLASLPRSDCFPTPALPGRTVGVFFGRAASGAPRLGRFARDVCDRLGRSAEWLPWFDHQAGHDYLAAVRRGFPRMALHPLRARPLLGDLLARVAQCSLIITDTYHLSLHAWRAGVPAICIGDAIPNTQYWDVSGGWPQAWRDKRQVFYAMHDAMELYVLGEELTSRERWIRRLDQLERVMSDRRVVDAVVQRLRARRDLVERQLVAELRRLLAKAATGHSIRDSGR